MTRAHLCLCCAAAGLCGAVLWLCYTSQQRTCRWFDCAAEAEWQRRIREASGR